MDIDRLADRLIDCLQAYMISRIPGSLLFWKCGNAEIQELCNVEIIYRWMFSHLFCDIIKSE